MAISVKITVLLIEVLLVRLRSGALVPWIGRVAPHRRIQARRSVTIVIERVFRLNEAGLGHGAVTPMQT